MGFGWRFVAAWLNSDVRVDTGRAAAHLSTRKSYCLSKCNIAVRILKKLQLDIVSLKRRKQKQTARR
jgi:hypothetical protein